MMKPQASISLMTLRLLRDVVRDDLVRTSTQSIHNSLAYCSTTRAVDILASHPVGRRQIISRPFTTSRCLYKKKSKATRDEDGQDDTSSKSQQQDDPYDFDTLNEDVSRALEYMRSSLSKLRGGGRFNHELIETLRVQPDKQSKDKVKLSDLAQVIPKGRIIQIIVGEKEHVKPVTSSIQGSDLSLTPQPDPTGNNPLLLEIKLPPPTAESRQTAVKEAVKIGEKAGTTVRDARSKQHKKHRAMQLSGTANPDHLRKAGKQMEKIVEQGHADVKKAVDNAKKVLESG